MTKLRASFSLLLEPVTPCCFLHSSPPLSCILALTMLINGSFVVEGYTSMERQKSRKKRCSRFAHLATRFAAKSADHCSNFLLAFPPLLPSFLLRKRQRKAKLRVKFEKYTSSDFVFVGGIKREIFEPFDRIFPFLPSLSSFLVSISQNSCTLVEP